MRSAQREPLGYALVEWCLIRRVLSYHDHNPFEFHKNVVPLIVNF